VLKKTLLVLLAEEWRWEAKKISGLRAERALSVVELRWARRRFSWFTCCRVR
jgi:hypothetical protein